MVQILKESKRLIELPVYLRDLKAKGYTKGSWRWVPGTDYVEVRAWGRVKKK